MTHLYGALTTWKTSHLVLALGESEARPGTLAAMVVSSPNLALPATYSVNKYSRGVCNVLALGTAKVAPAVRALPNDNNDSNRVCGTHSCAH